MAASPGTKGLEMDQLNEKLEIKASHEDALKYAQAALDKYFSEMLKMGERHGATGMLMSMSKAASKLDATIEAIAFCFGVSAARVERDLKKVCGVDGDD